MDSTREGRETKIMKKHWYEVYLSQKKIIRVFAEDSEEAREKAESKLNKRNSVWVANAAYREDGNQEDSFVAQ